MKEQFGLAIRRGCACVGLSHGSFYRQPQDWMIRDAGVIDMLNELVEAHPRWGFWKYVDAIRNSGKRWNHKRIYRVYCNLGLNQPRRTKRKLPERPRQELFVPAKQGQFWSADFMSDSLYYGPRFRTFNVIDDHNREALAIEIDTSLRAGRIVRVLERLKDQRDTPDVIRLYYGPEFLSQTFVDWCKGNHVLVQLYPTRQTEPECLHRTIQPDLSQRSAESLLISEFA